MANNPKISIIMLAYNSEKFIRLSIESILNQTFSDFEFLIVYDESNDNTLEILNEYADNDKRIIILKNENRKGIVGAANTGLYHTKGEYIARMDSDDISHKRRFEKQITFMEKHREFGLLGTGYGIIDGKGKTVKKKMILAGRPEKIPSILVFENNFVQSSVMIRKCALDEIGYYSPDIPSCEDYDLWIRLAGKYKVWNLPEILVSYRIHSGSDTVQQVEIRQKMLSIIHSKMFDNLGFDYNGEDLLIHFMIYNNNFSPDMKNIGKIKKWLVKLYLQSRLKKNPDPVVFAGVISEKWFDICYYSSVFLGMKIWKEYRNFKLAKKHKPGFIKQAKFFIKCMAAKRKISE